MNTRKTDSNDIKAFFNTISPKYDLNNFLLSFGMNINWRRHFIRSFSNINVKHYADICCGTGSVVWSYLSKIDSQNCRNVYLVDFSDKMLQKAQKNRLRYRTACTRSYHFVENSVTELTLPDSSLDLITIAYGVRNFKDPDASFREIKRVLKPNGKLYILELTKPTMFFGLYRLYLSYILPQLSRLLINHKKAYDYLGGSILTYHTTEELVRFIESFGFSSIHSQSLTFGSASVCGFIPQ
jgi:demethylmenaquinone methyltransferase / 2-methoxy-6-polyprenyl-1,4-benzoquinol methylase